jgi:hypothetical protein
MKMRKTKTEILASAMDVLAREIQSGDGVANAAIAEAAERLRELAADSKRLDWLCANSHICIETMDSSEYPNTRSAIDAAMPNEKS